MTVFRPNDNNMHGAFGRIPEIGDDGARPPAQDVPIIAQAFTWRDPASLPAREWLYGRNLIRRFVSVTVAPGGLGKSSLTIVEALAMASNRQLLGEWVAGHLGVWLFNLEDPADELDRRITAAMMHHGVNPDEIAGRLFRNSGRERGLCTALQGRDGVQIMKPELDALATEIGARNIDVLIVDPFVSSHRVSENDNGAIDLVAKEWGRLAERCNIAIELVHHTRKANGEAANSESSRGAVALIAAARSVRVLNRMTDDQRAEAGVTDDPATFFALDRDKANLAPPGKRQWRRMASVDLGNGDSVGVAEEWTWPDDFDGVSIRDLLAVQRAIAAACEAGSPPRSNVQAKDWAGRIVADALGINLEAERKRITRMLRTWRANGALIEVIREDAKRNPRPCLEVGEWATQ